MATNRGKEQSFDLYEPEATCLDEERFGTRIRYDAFGDGPKFICGVDYLAKKAAAAGENCLVYSVGSKNHVELLHGPANSKAHDILVTPTIVRRNSTHTHRRKITSKIHP